ncbi:hypothetical protein, partial [Herbaspirillum rhizosphaerae]|uniref:hypothetical protein n=1 Tax=Herbaspirillum rhizosphaerae TaxID=346179 RepID=UPI001969D1B8
LQIPTWLAASCFLLRRFVSGEANYSKGFPIRATIFAKLFKLFTRPCRKPAPSLNLALKKFFELQMHSAHPWRGGLNFCFSAAINST